MLLILIKLVLEFKIRCVISLLNWYWNSQLDVSFPYKTATGILQSDASYPYKTGIGINNEVPLRLVCTVTSLTSFIRKNMHFFF